jgi:hypothetical protein
LDTREDPYDATMAGWAATYRHISTNATANPDKYWKAL